MTQTTTDPTLAQNPMIKLLLREIERGANVLAGVQPAVQAIGFRTMAKSLRAHAKTLERQAERLEVTEYQRAVTEHDRRLAPAPEAEAPQATE